LVSKGNKWMQACPHCGALNPDPDTSAQTKQVCTKCGKEYQVDNPSYRYQNE
jgi:DNA-directed RNA polymerase subunit M/transcription elongation factor TFIIS